MRLLGVAILVVLVSGCSDAPPTGGQASASESSTPSPQEDDPVVIDPAIDPRRSAVEFTDCHSFQYSSYQQPGAEQSSVPAEWQPSEPVISTIHLIQWHCQRVSLGPFERGPITFVLEGHTFHDLPEGCRQVNETTFAYVLQRIWTDDQEVADFLRAYHGLTVEVATFAIAWDNSTGGLRHVTWSWPTGQGTTRFEVFDADPSGAADVTPIRFLWATPQGAAWMELRHTVVGPHFTDRAGTAEVAPPMLGAGPATPFPFRLLTGDGHGTLREFGDMSCETSSWP